METTSPSSSFSDTRSTDSTSESDPKWFVHTGPRDLSRKTNFPNKEEETVRESCPTKRLNLEFEKSRK